MRKKLIALLAAAALAGAACSSGTDAVPGADGTPNPGKQTTAEKGKGKGNKGRKGKAGDGKNTQKRKEGAAKKGGGKGLGGPGDPGAPAPGAEPQSGTYDLEPQGEGGPRFATLSAHYRESAPDAKKEGPLIPRYAEANQVDVEGLGDNLRITFTFDAELPQKMPTEQTYMFISFALSAEKKNEKGYGITAQGSQRGWQAALGSKEDAERFPGTFFVRGNTAEFTLPWSAVGGPRPFEFYASGSWFQYAGTTSYSIDPIPNDKGSYPN